MKLVHQAWKFLSSIILKAAEEVHEKKLRKKMIELGDQWNKIKIYLRIPYTPIEKV